MKRILGLAALFLTIIALTGYAAQIIEIPFVPLSPVIMGQGGACIADARGYDSFFYNPAGYSRSAGAFTALSTTEWFHARPDLLLTQIWQMATGSAGGTSTLNFLNSQVTTGGLGTGAALGFGYVGDGFGLGAAFIMDSILFGQSLLGMTGDLTATLGFMGGLSIPFDVAGIRVHAGADIRPMIRVHTPIPNSQAISVVSALANGGSLGGAIGTATSYYGSAIALDFGVIAELSWFTFGLSIRDLGGTTFMYTQNSFDSVTGSLGAHGTFPAGSQASDTYVIPMDIGFGVTFHPDLGDFRYFVDPRISVDLRNINGAIDGSAVFWTLLHAGAEVRLLNTFAIRAGLNQGYLTFGLGMKVLVFDMNMAVFTQELGVHLGDQPASGMSFNADIRI